MSISKYNTVTFLKDKLLLQYTEAGSKVNGERHTGIYNLFTQHEENLAQYGSILSA